MMTDEIAYVVKGKKNVTFEIRKKFDNFSAGSYAVFSSMVAPSLYQKWSDGCRGRRCSFIIRVEWLHKISGF
jgi:hypothetical protein